MRSLYGRWKKETEKDIKQGRGCEVGSEWSKCELAKERREDDFNKRTFRGKDVRVLCKRRT